jgi:hypothetical protein
VNLVDEILEMLEDKAACEASTLESFDELTKYEWMTYSVGMSWKEYLKQTKSQDIMYDL